MNDNFINFVDFLSQCDLNIYTEFNKFFYNYYTQVSTDIFEQISNNLYINYLTRKLLHVNYPQKQIRLFREPVLSLDVIFSFK